MRHRYVDRYAQGVLFDFQPTGRVYVFDYVYLINTLIVGLVLLGLAGTITDFVAFNLLPAGHSAMLSAHRFETVSRRDGFASLGTKTALAALSFSSFDPDNNKTIEVEDLVRVLAQVAFEPEIEGSGVKIGLDAEKAHALALAILRDEVDHTGSFSFVDYMGTQDNGSIPFLSFLKHVKIPTSGPQACGTWMAWPWASGHVARDGAHTCPLHSPRTHCTFPFWGVRARSSTTLPMLVRCRRRLRLRGCTRPLRKGSEAKARSPQSDPNGGEPTFRQACVLQRWRPSWQSPQLMTWSPSLSVWSAHRRLLRDGSGA